MENEITNVTFKDFNFYKFTDADWDNLKRTIGNINWDLTFSESVVSNLNKLFDEIVNACRGHNFPKMSTNERTEQAK